MPCTFSHPLAVVPLYRCCADRLNFAALVVGSMSPDFGYYVSQFPLATFAHTVLGLFAVCLPSGLAALGVFYLLRRPLCFVLPQPHRAALTRLAMRRWSITLRSLRTAALSTKTPEIGRRDWLILDALSDDFESIEQITRLLQEDGPGASSSEIIDRLERLHAAGHVFLTLDASFDRAEMVREIDQTRDRRFWFGRTPSGDALWERHAADFDDE